MPVVRTMCCWMLVAATAAGLPVRLRGQSAPASTPLRLEPSLDLLVDRNLPVIAARYNIDVFRAQRVAAGLKPDPTVVVSATQLSIPRVVTHPEYAGVATADGAILNTQYAVDVEKLVERGNKRQLRVAQADAQVAFAEAQLADELRQQRFALQQAFMSALLARENLRLSLDNLRDFSRMRDVFAAQVREGEAAGVDLRRLGLEMIDVQGRVSAAKVEFVQGVRDIWNLLGEGEQDSAASARLVAVTSLGTTIGPVQPSEQVAPALSDIVDGSLAMPPVSRTIEELRALALANRPDLRAAQLEVGAAVEGTRLAEATRIRDVTLGAQYMRSGPDNAIGLAVGVPLTTARRADTAMAQATALTRQVEARLRQQRAQVLTDVEKAFLGYRINRDRLRMFDGEVLRQASDVRTIEQVAYREGQRGLLALLDAQRAYNQTLVSYNEARSAVAMSIYLLESATATSAAVLAAPSSSGVAE